VTSSRLSAVVKKGRNAEASARETYKVELLAERISGDAEWHPVTWQMQEGLELEPVARTEYEFANGCEVEPIGLATHPSIKGFSASTDGLIEPGGMVEIKCPQKQAQTRLWLTRKIPDEYLWQAIGGLCCAERDWCDFVSYCPKMKLKHLQLYVQRIPRDQKLISALELEVEQFLKEVSQLEELLRKPR
jgi:hypothetical protein